MNNASKKDIEDFLFRFRRGLAALPKDSRDDLVGELRSHFEDRSNEGKLDLAGEFGSPEEYAARFVNADGLRSAASGSHPLRLITVLLGGVRSTAIVVCVVLPCAVLEIMGLSLVLIGACKPFDSNHIGLFLDADGRLGSLGWSRNPGLTHEVLGCAVIPIFLFGGLLLFWACHRLLLKVARHELARIAAGLVKPRNSDDDSTRAQP